ncbi:hypothetical protein, partial [Thiolapillus sp.]|uniref:hypothetical protein n=2 Tax=Thiolapillus sp. TaxID=2017437 RepID=UPI0025D14B60
VKGYIEMTDTPSYPITIYFHDGGNWIKTAVYDNEFDLVVGLEFADTDEPEEAWAIRATDRYGREVSLRVEAIELVHFRLK